MENTMTKIFIAGIVAMIISACSATAPSSVEDVGVADHGTVKSNAEVF